MTEAIATQKELLRGFGGHPMAAGMSFDADKLIEFRRGLGKAIEKQMGTIVREEAALQIDAWLDLNELNLELANSLEMLAPFGAGNPALTLATRNVSLKSISTIGKTKEHLRLTIEDEGGNVQSILWWGGAGEEKPEEGSKFDISYSLRASSYRGQKQVTVQFEEFRIVEEKPVEVRKSKIEIKDMRLESASLLAKLQKQAPALQIWAEGAEKSKGRSRFDLQQVDDFLIYTTPPSPVELRRALEIVKPKTISVFAIPPAEEKPEEYLNRLAGLCKYTLNNYEGRTTLGKLAAAMASRESAIEFGLQWLAAAGHASVSVEDDAVILSAEKPEANPYLQKELYLALRGILNEISAYRKYFATVEDVAGLFEVH
ncbi:hypothetical protein [Candidatus Villigracilis proximus]|uniref:hypothetical protein n=1 Tax=Candidatus Villigracilis proximus TaxID=3140683 RepID=UPI0031E81A54